VAKRTYEEALSHIHGLYRFGSRLGLTRPRRLLAALGNPHLGLKVIHVAGTNGKGSVAAMLASVLEASGYLTGLYISPYITDFRERIRVNGEPIAPGEVAELVFDELVPAARDLASPPGDSGENQVTEFEFVTALGLLYYARRGVDFLVCEVGLGGRFDATNVIDRPLLSVITSMGLDHTDYLGPRLEDVAAEKAGIIKRGAPVLTAAQEPEAFGVIAAAARRRGADLYLAANSGNLLGLRAARARGVSGWGWVTLRDASLHGQVLDYRGPGFPFEAGLNLRLLGPHQLDNAAVALTAAAVLKERGLAPDVDGTSLRRGLGATDWPGRFEVFHGRPPVIVDGAHNPPGARALAGALRQLTAGRRLFLVIGILGDKDAGAYLSSLLTPALPGLAAVFTSTPDSPRAMPAADLADLVRRTVPDLRVEASGDVGAAVRAAAAAAGPSDVICVAGSLYQVAGARAAAREVTSRRGATENGKGRG